MHQKESIRVRGSELVETVKGLLRQNTIGRLCIRYEENRAFEITLMAGDPSAPANVLKEPVLAAINALGALANECTIEVERTGKSAGTPSPG